MVVQLADPFGTSELAPLLLDDVEGFEFDPDDIPPGMDPEEFMEALRQRMAGQAGPDGQPPAAKPLTEEQKRAAALLAQYVRIKQLPRTPSGILKTLADREEPKTDTKPPSETQPPETQPPADAEAPPSPPPQQFFQQVVVGDWGAVKDHLAELPEDVAAKVYGHLLALLGRGGQTTLLPDEILSLADAAPAELSDSQLAALGRLVGVSLGHVDQPRTMLAKIAEGTERLGGSDPKRRLAAARLLIAAGMTKAAGPYLPDLAQVLQDQDAELTNLHASHFLALDRQEPDEENRRQAWELSQTILGLPEVDAKQRAAALQRSLSLLPNMPDEIVDDWLRTVLTERPVLGLRVLAAVVQQVESAISQRDPGQREKALETQRRVADQLLEHKPPDDPTRAIAIELMTFGWLKEAQFAMALADSRSRRSASAGEAPRWAGIARMLALAGEGKMRPLSAKVLLPLCPDQAWCEAVEDDVASQLRRLNGRLAALAADGEKTFAAIRHFVETDPEYAQQLAQEFVGKWSAQRSGSGDDVEYDVPFGFSGRPIHPGMFSSSSMMMRSHRSRSGGIPLTRAKQVRNLEEYAQLLREIGELGTPSLEPSVLVAAFQTCHSPAEVYREEDIEQVFGPIGELHPGVAWTLASNIRQRLAREWRKPEVQQQMNTRRTDKEQVEQVRRGYDLAVRLATAAKQYAKRGLSPAVLLASTYFDQAEFEYGQQADLATYSKLRDLAFSTYRQAAELYVELLPDRKPEERSVDIYQRWFQSALGASDLAYLTRQDRPDHDQVDQIAAALAGLGEEESEEHLKLFGTSITRAMSSVPPHLKPHFLRESLRVLGDHESGKAARERLEYYDELLREVQLHLAVDGPAEVGHGRPFGARFSIRSTDALGRESGGFTSLLQKGYSQSTQQEIDHKEKVEEMLREKLTESFEVDLVRFHDPNVDPRGFGRRGWKETPLAYLVLRSKDPSVDRLPVVHVDLEFDDGNGSVLLPVTSQVVLIDSRDEDPEVRPFGDVEIKQVLDDRRLAEGQIRVEVEAKAKGLIPELDELLDVSNDALAGFAIAKSEDLGLEVAALDTTGDEVEPICNRRWMLDLEPAGETPIAEFRFPTSPNPDVAMAYQRYDDADIVDTEAAVPLRSFAFPRYSWWWIGGGLAGIVLIGVVAVVAVRASRRTSHVAVSAYRKPDPLTPFNLVVLLKQIHGDEHLGLAPGERDDLGDAIGRLEQHFFGPDGEPGEAAQPNLTTLADRWLARASTNGSSVTG